MHYTHTQCVFSELQHVVAVALSNRKLSRSPSRGVLSLVACLLQNGSVSRVSALATRRQFSTPSTLFSLLPTTNLKREAIVSTPPIPRFVGGTSPFKESDTLSLSYKDLRDQALSFAGKLTRDLGYKTGDKIAMVLGENCIEHVIVQLGAAAAGVMVVSAKSPAEPALGPQFACFTSTKVQILTQETSGQLPARASCCPLRSYACPCYACVSNVLEWALTCANSCRLPTTLLPRLRSLSFSLPPTPSPAYTAPATENSLFLLVVLE